MFKRPSVTQDQLVLNAESAVQALASTSPVAASCTLTADTNTNMADGDTVTLNDGFRIVVYEYDKSSDGVTAGHVAVAAGTTADTVALAFQTAINANQPGLNTSDNGSGVLTITNKWLGAGGNQTNSKSSSSALAVTNFSGGVDPALSANLSGTTTQKFNKVERTMRVDSVQYLIPATGSTQDATNYWDIELKDGSTSIAKYSTQTAQQGTITAGTPVELVLNATSASCVAAPGDTLSMVFTKHGSPSNLPPGRMTVHAHYVE